MMDPARPTRGTVLMLSGWFGSRCELVSFGALLAADGWQVLTSLHADSRFTPAEMPGRRVILGYSTGALPALELARCTKPDALILVAPLWRLAGTPLLPPARSFAGSKPDPATGDEVALSRLAGPASPGTLPVRLPLLVIQGNGDPVARPGEAQRWLGGLTGSLHGSLHGSLRGSLRRTPALYREISGDHELLSDGADSALRAAAISLEFLDALP